MMRRINKKGASFSGWTEAIILVIVILGMLVLIGTEMNRLYGRSDDYSLGLQTNSSLESFKGLQNQFQTVTETGEVQTTGQYGISLPAVWGLMKSVASITWSFITGGFINNLIVNVLKLPIELAIGLRILFFLSIGFIIIKIFMKVIP